MIVQFWTPSPVTQCRGERVQDHLSAHARRLVSFLANGYCACVHLAWQYGGGFEGIGLKVQENLLEYDPVFVHEVDNRPGGIHDRYDCQQGLKDSVEWK